MCIIKRYLFHDDQKGLKTLSNRSDGNKTRTSSEMQSLDTAN